MSEKRFKLDYGEDDAIFIVEDDDIVYPIRNDTIKEYQLQNLVDKLNEQQATIEMYQRRVHKREEQISIIKKYCLKFLTDEQVEIIRKELENE